jgi:hypothetical protein
MFIPQHRKFCFYITYMKPFLTKSSKHITEITVGGCNTHNYYKFKITTLLKFK